MIIREILWKHNGPPLFAAIWSPGYKMAKSCRLYKTKAITYSDFRKVISKLLCLKPCKQKFYIPANMKSHKSTLRVERFNITSAVFSLPVHAYKLLRQDKKLRGMRQKQ